MLIQKGWLVMDLATGIVRPLLRTPRPKSYDKKLLSRTACVKNYNSGGCEGSDLADPVESSLRTLLPRKVCVKNFNDEGCEERILAGLVSPSLRTPRPAGACVKSYSGEGGGGSSLANPVLSLRTPRPECDDRPSSSTACVKNYNDRGHGESISVGLERALLRTPRPRSYDERLSSRTACVKNFNNGGCEGRDLAP
jgi:hypothetical protein